MINKHKISPSLIIFTCFLLFYIFVPNNNQGYDSYSYAISVRDGQDLFHPHHLIYNLFGYLIYELFKFTGWGSMKILSLANSLLAVFTLMLIYKIIRHKTGGLSASLGAILTGSLFTFWYCATSVEVNMLALFFLLGSLYFLIVKEYSPLSPWLVYLFLGIGTLFHQHIILAGIPIFIYYVFKYRSLGKALKPAYPGILGGALIYLVAAFQHASEKNIRGIYDWVTSYAQLGVWGKFRLSAFRNAIWGNLKLFFGGEKIRQIFYAGYYDYSTVIYIICILLISVGIAYLIIKSLYYSIKQHDRITVVLAALFVIYVLFTFWWAPAIDDFWLYPAVIFVIFFFISIIPGRGDRAFIIIMTALLIIVNTACEFVPSSKKVNSYTDQGVAAFKRLQLTGNNLVITNYSQIRLAYEYYTGIHVPTTCMMYLETGDKYEVMDKYKGRIIQAAESGRVIMFEDEIHPAPYRSYLYERFSPEDYEGVYGQFRKNLALVDSISVHGRTTYLYKLIIVE